VSENYSFSRKRDCAPRLVARLFRSEPRSGDSVRKNQAAFFFG
jgi:hypothetical protein